MQSLSSILILRFVLSLELHTEHRQIVKLFGILYKGIHRSADILQRLLPCVQAGIKTVIYDSDKYADTSSVKASKRMFDAAGVRYYKYNRSGREMKLNL